METLANIVILIIALVATVHALKAAIVLVVMFLLAPLGLISRGGEAIAIVGCGSVLSILYFAISGLIAFVAWNGLGII